MSPLANGLVTRMRFASITLFQKVLPETLALLLPLSALATSFVINSSSSATIDSVVEQANEEDWGSTVAAVVPTVFSVVGVEPPEDLGDGFRSWLSAPTVVFQVGEATSATLISSPCGFQPFDILRVGTDGTVEESEVVSEGNNLTFGLTAGDFVVVQFSGFCQIPTDPRSFYGGLHFDSA